MRLVGATVIDGTGEAPILDAVIEVRDGLIASVSPFGQGHEAPARYVIPGLIDAHVHVAISPLTYASATDPMALTDALLRSFVRHGVTTVRDPGTPDLGPFFQEMAVGRTGWPRFFGAGPLIDGPPGVHWAGTLVVDSVSSARQAVADLADGGARLIKTYFWMTPLLMSAVADAAHARGLPVSYHPGLLPVDEAVRAGVDQVEHVMNAPELLPVGERGRAADLPGHDWDSLRLFRLWEHVDPRSPAAETSVDLWARARTFLTPTLALSDALLAGPDGRHAVDGRAASMPAEVVARWEATAHREAYSADDLARAPAILERQLRFVQLAHDAGVRIAAGTGGLGHFIVPGASLHDELTLLVRAGLSTMEALVAGTRRGAELLGQPGLTGTLTSGAPADFVVLRDDPLADIANTRSIEAVVMRGELVWGTLA